MLRADTICSAIRVPPLNFYWISSCSSSSSSYKRWRNSSWSLCGAPPQRGNLKMRRPLFKNFYLNILMWFIWTVRSPSAYLVISYNGVEWVKHACHPLLLLPLLHLLRRNTPAHLDVSWLMTSSSAAAFWPHPISSTIHNEFVFNFQFNWIDYSYTNRNTIDEYLFIYYFIFISFLFI